MRPASVIDNEVLELSGFGRVPLAVGLNIKVMRAVEAVPYVAYFLSPKHIEVLSLLLSNNISGALSASYCSATTLCLARS